MPTPAQINRLDFRPLGSDGYELFSLPITLPPTEDGAYTFRLTPPWEGLRPPSFATWDAGGQVTAFLDLPTALMGSGVAWMMGTTPFSFGLLGDDLPPFSDTPAFYAGVNAFFASADWVDLYGISLPERVEVEEQIYLRITTLRPEQLRTPVTVNGQPLVWQLTSGVATVLDGWNLTIAAPDTDLPTSLYLTGEGVGKDCPLRAYLLDTPGQVVHLTAPSPVIVQVARDLEISHSPLPEGVSLSVYMGVNLPGRPPTWYAYTSGILASIPFNPIRVVELSFKVILNTPAPLARPVSLYSVMLTGSLQQPGENPMSRYGRICCSYQGDCADEMAFMAPYVPSVCEDSFNPYRTGAAMRLYNYLSNVASGLFGLETTYYRVVPDTNGTDTVLHEHHLFNYAARGKLKVMVPEGAFPQENFKQTLLDFGFLESFEAHITVDAFRAVFGEMTRPDRNDVVDFCGWRLYQVDAMIPAYGFMNQVVYYRVSMVPYEDKKNINKDPAITAPLEAATALSSLDKLFGPIESEVPIKVADPQLNPHSISEYRHSLHPRLQLVAPGITVGTVKLNDYSYDMSRIPPGDASVSYSATDYGSINAPSRTLCVWWQPVSPGASRYDIIDNNPEGGGYGLSLQGTHLHFQLGIRTYRLSVPHTKTDFNHWHCFIITVDGLQKEVKLMAYTPLFEEPRYGITSTLALRQHQRYRMADYQFSGSQDRGISLPAGQHRVGLVRILSRVVLVEEHERLATLPILPTSNEIILEDRVDPTLTVPNISRLIQSAYLGKDKNLSIYPHSNG